MKSTFGHKLKITIWGGSHEPAIGVDMEGFPANFQPDMEQLKSFMARRAPGNSPLTTPRKEPDTPVLVADERSHGGSLSYEIRNTNTRSGDYNRFRDVPRPGHADYTARMRYGNSVNMAGSGPFSARMTAPLCIAGGIAIQYLESRGITIEGRLTEVGGIPNDPTLTGSQVSQEIYDAILATRQEEDSLGGIVECTVKGIPAGIGGAMYDGVESILAPILYGIPAVKALEFGAGFKAASMKGSENNDAFYYDNGQVKTRTNKAGGILGGITTGMPLICRLAFKPTPSIGCDQESINMETGESAVLQAKGRHDPCVAIRAVPVVEAAMALGLLDCILITESDSTYTEHKNRPLYGLIGRSLVHSFSKEIHEELGHYKYDLISLEPRELADYIGKRNFKGLNVTIPYKEDVIPLCDSITDRAKAIGAVNTLYWEGSQLVGHNTDYDGFLYTANRSNISFQGRTVLILGTGGTSKTVRAVISDQGASKIYIASRKAGDGLITYDSLSRISEEVEIIVNTAPVGTYPNNGESIISLDDFPKCRGVIDVIYNPFKTSLLLDAEDKGLKFANGLPMLVAQATAAAGYFLGRPGEFHDKNEAIIEKLVERMGNITLIGMPGCGKSTCGKLLADDAQLNFVDVDDEIVKTASVEADREVSIPQIFVSEGEAGFRDREAAEIARISKEHGQVIATGGGCVLRKENVRALRQNGSVIHLTRPIHDLPTEGRPLSQGKDALTKLAEERMPLYEAAADLTMDSSALLKILKLI